MESRAFSFPSRGRGMGAERDLLFADQPRVAPWAPRHRVRSFRRL